MLYRTIAEDALHAEDHLQTVESIQKAILDALQRATNSIRFMVFAFTDREIGNLMAAKKKSGCSSSPTTKNLQAAIGAYRDGFEAGRDDARHHRALPTRA